LIATSDGGYAIAGGWNCSAGGADFWLIKTDEFGNVEWNQTYGGELSDRLGSLVATSDGGYALAGITNASDIESGDFWLIKTDENGVAPVVPEAPWVVLPLLVTATLAIFISKKKLHIRSQVA